MKKELIYKEMNTQHFNYQNKLSEFHRDSYNSQKNLDNKLNEENRFFFKMIENTKFIRSGFSKMMNLINKIADNKTETKADLEYAELIVSKEQRREFLTRRYSIIFQRTSTFNDINFTVYDWKENRKIKKTEIIAWNIGGNSKEDTNKILKEINSKLNG